MGEAVSADAVWQDMQTRGIEFVFAQFVDMYARPVAAVGGARRSTECSRTGPASRASPPVRSGRLRATPTSPRSPIWRATHPSRGSRTSLASPATSRSRARAPFCPRTILRRQLKTATDKGFEFKMGLELEYFLVEAARGWPTTIADPYDTLEKPCYDMAGLTRRYDF